MADLALPWGDDLALTGDGDLSLVDGLDMDNQSVVRRLLTDQGAYVWHLDYGASLRKRIGSVARERVIQAIVRSQMLLEASAARVPVPKIFVTEDEANPGLFVISITYRDAITGVDAAIRQEIPT